MPWIDLLGLNSPSGLTGKHFFDTLEDPSEDQLVPIAVSSFSDDPYMKVMQAYYATNELPIPPPPAPIALPPSLVLSPQFDPRNFFLPEEILPPWKQARFLSHSSADFAAPPQIFKIGESSYKTPLERHEEQIEAIMNHLDELPLERIKEMEDKIRARTQIAGLQKKQMEHDDEVVLARVRISTLEMIIEDIQNGSQEDIDICSTDNDSGCHQELVADSVATALKAQAANIANADNTNRNTKPREAPIPGKYSYKEFLSFQPFNFKGTKGVVRLIRWFERTKSVFSRRNCTEDCKVKFSTGTLTDEALSWWNSFAQPIGIEEAYKITYLIVKGNDLKTYVRRFQELAVLCPTMVPNSEKMMEVFIGGLPPSIKGNVTASKPQTLKEAITITQGLMDQKLVPKSKQQCLWESIHAEGQERLPKSKRSHVVVIGMDCLSKYHAKILCDEKVIHIPIDSETLIIQVFIDDILIYSRNKEEYADHLRIILEFLKKEKLYAKFSKCDFWINIVQFLRYMIDSQGIHVDPTKIKAVKNWASPNTPIELCEAPILALPEGNEDVVVYYNASLQDILQLLVETPDNPFVTPDIETIKAFMNKKESIQYPRFIKLIIANLMKKFLEIPKRIKEDYHSIKDDIPLIRATDDFKEYEMVFTK
nr:reverse transcriptase domain-containing protein [Tanacetum cinerariifolium]